jgi:hypothetical protein
VERLTLTRLHYGIPNHVWSPRQHISPPIPLFATEDHDFGWGRAGRPKTIAPQNNDPHPHRTLLSLEEATDELRLGASSAPVIQAAAIAAAH